MGGEACPDVVGFGRVCLGVQGECLLPVVTGLLVLAIVVVAVGQVAVGACLVVGVAGLGCQLQCGLELFAGRGGLAGLVQGLGEACRNIASASRMYSMACP
jgi:hypothetical protein